MSDIKEPEEKEVAPVEKEEKKKPGPKPKVSTETKKINLITIPGKQITKDAQGYHFENILIGFDIPTNVLAIAIAERLPERNISANDAFNIAKARLNEFAISKGFQRAYHKNGLIHWPEGEFSNHAVGPEVYIQILIDHLKYNPELKVFYKEIDRMYILQKLAETIKVL
jgi:hypothetical protein